MYNKFSFKERIHFFFEALKKHLVLYIMAVVFLLAFGGVGLGILLFTNDLDLGELIFGSVFLFVGIGCFILIFYLNISSMQYWFNSAVMKRYARYRKAAITEVTHEYDTVEGIILCFISINHQGYILTDVFELAVEKEYLLVHLKKKLFISIRIAEQLPSSMRIAPRKLLAQLEEIHKKT